MSRPKSLVSPFELKSTLPNAKSFQASLKAKRILLVYDNRLLGVSALAKWISQFENGCAVSAGESLKSLESLNKTLPIFLSLIKGVSRQDVVLVSMGGGSVGDFCGFVASVLKRGVRLVHIPTTWLAAADSAHGGKTALNVGDIKNQIGTFYPAEKILIARDVLVQQGPEHLSGAIGEILKMALIADPKQLKKFSKSPIDNGFLWNSLKSTIKNKYKFVRQDPFEEKGMRQVLNFGHTLGHAFELSSAMAHGLAVFFGMKFAIDISHHRGLLNAKDYKELSSLFDLVTKKLAKAGGFHRPTILRPSQLRDFLIQDKKAIHGNQIRFVFLKGVGRPVVEAVSVDDVVMEAVRQGYAR